MLDEISASGLALLGLLVFVAGIVDSLAGGGGLITLPAYLAAGLDPALVLGTNKLASSLGTIVSSFRYQKAVKLEASVVLPALAASLIGSFLGARLALILDPALLRPILLGALPAAAYLVLAGSSLRAPKDAEPLTPREVAARASAVSLPIGCYDGFFGPGTGTFFAIAFSRLCRWDLLQATAAAKILNLVSNVAALTAFLAAGRVHLALGLAMGALSVAGNAVGSGLGIRKGSAAIRPFLAAVCVALFFKVLADFLR